ncbi:MAG: copper amine oxidase N-terminal domain-containing protein, partial [Anaerotignum sp.]|nr:copper amine oxidase N-terminal domain-containing protein [Anaerotignum sp.]
VITSYTENTTMDVTATGNTLDIDDGITNAIYKADGIVAQEGISTDRVAKIGDAQYKTLEDAIEAASAGDAIELMEDINDATLNGATVDLPAGGEVVIGEGGSYELPAGSKVTVGDKETTLSNGGSIAADGTVTATPVPSSGKGGGSSKPKYTATVDKDDIENGSVKLSSTRVKAGSTVTITVTPDEGYELDELKVLDKDGNEVELTDKGNGKYTFKMPKGGVEIEASFEEADEVDEPAVDKKEETTLVLTIGQVIYQLDGEHKANDVAPIIKADRTFLPIRLIAETLGATVTWNEAEQSVTIVKDDTTIVIYIGQAFALVNGEPVQLDAPAFIQNDRTYLPVRFIAENLGATVTWDGTANTVTIVG